MKSKNSKTILGRDLSEWLSRKSERLSGRTKKLSLLISFIAIGCYCLILIFGNSKTLLLSQKISLPGISSPNEKVIVGQRIQSLTFYLDSLQTTSDGLMVYDSLLSAHPNIYDSISKWQKQFEQLP